MTIRRALCTSILLLSFFCIEPTAADPVYTQKNTPDDPYQEAMQALSEGRIDDAKESLDLLIKTEPLHAGAWLDMAILYCGLGNEAEAQRLFNEIESRFSPPPAILEVINQHKSKGCRKKNLELLTLRLGRGFDTNANQGVNDTVFSLGNGSSRIDLVVLPAFLPKRDSFSALSGEYVRELSSDGCLAFALLQARKYDHQSNFDTLSMLVGAEQPWRIGNIRLRGIATAGTLSLGGRLYMKQSQLQLHATLPVGLPSGWQFGIAGGWSHLSYPSFSAYDGNTFEVRHSLRVQTAKGNWHASYGALFDQQTNQRPGGDRKGYFTSLEGHIHVTGNIFAELGWQRQRWHGEKNYSPGLIDFQRRQDTQTIRASLAFPLTRQMALHTEYRSTDNRENISIFQFKGRTLQISLQWQP